MRVDALRFAEDTPYYILHRFNDRNAECRSATRVAVEKMAIVDITGSGRYRHRSHGVQTIRLE